MTVKQQASHSVPPAETGGFPNSKHGQSPVLEKTWANILCSLLARPFSTYHCTAQALGGAVKWPTHAAQKPLPFPYWFLFDKKGRHGAHRRQSRLKEGRGSAPPGRTFRHNVTLLEGSHSRRQDGILSQFAASATMSFILLQGRHAPPLLQKCRSMPSRPACGTPGNRKGDITVVLVLF